MDDTTTDAIITKRLFQKNIKRSKPTFMLIAKKLLSSSAVSKVFFVLLAIISVAVSSCRVQLVPEYSSDIETQITNAAKMTDMLYLEIMDASADKKNYDLYADKYLAIETEINSILLKDQARPKAQDLVASVQKLHDYFVKAKEDHKNRNVLNNAELLIYNEQLKALWKPVLVEEMALK